MSLRRSFAVFGMSAAIAAGGGVSLKEAIDQKSLHEQQLACQTEQFAGSTACKDIMLSPGIVGSTHETQKIYSWIAGLGLVFGALGMWRGVEIASVPEATTRVPGTDQEQTPA